MHRRAPQHDEWIFALAIALLALAPRLYVAIVWAGEPVWDGHYYDVGARRMAAGFGYSDDAWIGGQLVQRPWCHYPVGYSALLAALYSVFGSSRFVPTLANAAIGVAIAVLTHALASRMLSPWRARLAGVLCALHPGLVLYTLPVMTELVSTLGPLLALWLGLRLHESRRPVVAWVSAGFTLGLSTLVHPQAILRAPAMGPVLRLGQGWRKMASVALCVTLVALAVVAPWTYRNCRVMDGCAFVSTNGGWNLAIGAVERATGRFETLRASDGCRVVTGQVQQDRCWAWVGAQAIYHDPVRWLRLIPKKLGHLLDHESFPVQYLHQSLPELWPESRRARWREGLTLVHRCLLSVAVFGFISRGARRLRGICTEAGLSAVALGLAIVAWTADTPVFWPLGVAIAVLGALPRPSAPEKGPVGVFIWISFALVLGTHAVFFGEDRYHVPLIPLLVILAASVFRRERAPAALG